MKDIPELGQTLWRKVFGEIDGILQSLVQRQVLVRIPTALGQTGTGVKRKRERVAVKAVFPQYREAMISI